MKLWDLDTQHCFHTIVGHRSEVIKRGGVGGILGCEVYVFVSWYCKLLGLEDITAQRRGGRAKGPETKLEPHRGDGKQRSVTGSRGSHTAETLH